MGPQASALATPTRMGDHKSLEGGGVLVEEELKWKSLRWLHRNGGSLSLGAPPSASEPFFFFLCFGLSLCHVPSLSSSPNLCILWRNGHYLLCILTSV